MNDPLPDDAFVGEERLAYPASRRRFQPGERLEFDQGYRLAHLPLVAPGHPLAIASAPGQDYQDGTYPEWRQALVVPVDWPALAASPAFQALEREMAAGPFAAKIAWNLGRRRRHVLHATLASGLAAAAVPVHAAALTAAMAALGPLRFRLGGPLVGNRNFGRIYLPAYPRQVGGDDAFARLQDAVGARRSGFYGVGLYHLTDPLDAHETAALADLLDRWQDRVVAELELDRVVIHATRDDLVLSGRNLAEIRAKK
ncbi:hypothetical protein EDC65_0438 [Stella humosa]|uniref:Uncharacterized protein n=1 Tax=Stella humosa TaxID=94 RepID=A0A3N1MEX7_9PROT|nr:hypothetical protein [Stella humosa]ROQ01260.1 hypothetical protein EDC65_0438 [Stella humosa]BBK31634.1 hypothetical protein STHU_22680 [Stella humosa]